MQNKVLRKTWMPHLMNFQEAHVWKIIDDSVLDSF